MGTATELRDASSQVRDLIEPWTRACLQRDWDALLSMCNDDIIFLPPGAPAVTGEAVRPWLDTFPNIREMAWSVTKIDQDGDTAWLHGPVTQTLEIDGQTVRFDGKYTDVMRRGRDGGWRFSIIIWNSNQA
jgi:ketosteroid isomerase-like protein